jgi:phenylalanyl-tRNA synthetase beta chain
LKILVSWLRELVDVRVPPATLAHDLHLTGFEVASIEPPPGSAGTGTEAVIDFEITSNRPDCLSVAGIAREVATKYGTTLRRPVTATLGAADPSRSGPLTVVIEDPERCPRYCAALVDVAIGPSPAWLTDRLAAAGVRAINNVVDVTNYVLLELGHPMHAFDFDRLHGHAIHVRLARPGERLTTLDGQTRDIAPDMLLIADGERATAIGGVMGGGDSEVSAATRVVALESAWFLPSSVRRTSRRLGLSTEASYRFERGADIGAPPVALARACHLLEQIGAGRARPGWIDAFPAPRTPAVVTLSAARVRQVLGVEVDPADIDRILSGLGFRLTAPAGETTSWRVEVPTWRIDVARDVDLVEEVARHYGYDRLPTTFPALTQSPAPPDVRLERERFLRRLAAATGSSESVTFSFIDRKAALEFAPESELVAIANPLSETFAVLRPSLLPGLVASVGHNRRHGIRDVRLFETGTRFTSGGGETHAFSLAWTGAASAEHWSGSGRDVDFFDVKGVVETLANGLGLTVSFAPVERSWLARGRAAAVFAHQPDGKPPRAFGELGQLLPAVADARGIPAHDEVYVAELDLDAVAGLITLETDRHIAPLPRYPSIVRDLSIIVDDALPADAVRGTIRDSAPSTLEEIAEFDRYRGTGVPDERVSLSYHLVFRASDRTLTDAEVQEAVDAIVAALQRTHGAVQR